MKKFTLILASILVSLMLMAQDQHSIKQEHLSFKGVPIEGSITSFCQKLKAKGFTHQYIRKVMRGF